MEPRTQAMANRPAALDRIATACAGCGADVTVDVRRRLAVAADGSGRAITYADTDITVWDCPACEHPNADELR